MKPHIHAALSLALLGGAALAHAQDDLHTTIYDTPNGPLIVRWGQPEGRHYGPPPPFAQLDTRGTGYIDSNDAEAYPPLANDFGYADSNRDGRISRAEYARWASQR